MGAGLADAPGINGEEAAARTVDEGLLIALNAVRMAVKNKIIIGALRDRKPFVPEDYLEAAREEIDLLAEQNEALRARVGQAADRQPVAAHKPLSKNQKAEMRRLELLDGVYEHLAETLRATGKNDDEVAELVEIARRDAWSEIGDAWTTKFGEDKLPETEEEYQRKKAGRVQELIYMDLAALAHRNAPPRKTTRRGQ